MLHSPRSALGTRHSVFRPIAHRRHLYACLSQFFNEWALTADFQYLIIYAYFHT